MKVSDLIIRNRQDPDLMICGTPEEYAEAQRLIREYADWLSVDLAYDDFENEINNLINYYGPPTGLIILAIEKRAFVGVVCIRNLGEFIAEIKRMYVQPTFRGRGIGRKLLKKAIAEAKGLGYRYLRLDTIPEMKSAIDLFSSSGFYEIEDLGASPYAGVRFMEYKL
ncbi:MAG: GNAT family N-acetyltransferase [Saprospiraceae bacterium]|nr:GNAT family N-acetyltransferase [Saprospiraceae bacterium]